MCGICGYMGAREEGLIEDMTAALAHRGPDSVGYYQGNDVAFGHRRLSIIDLEGGQQPIENEDGSLILICNGEIYNYQALRNELLSKGHRFRTKSDSEVVLHLFEDMGPECVLRLNGIFAIAIYDKKRRQLFLARDHLGVKPLYYADLPGRFLFASESKSLLRFQRLNLTLNTHAIHQYLALRYVPGPGGMFKEIRKVPAAHYAIVKNGEVRIKRYWHPELFSGPFEGSEEDYLEGFAEHFERSIKLQMISEVPLGAYLSGGLDSSVMVAVMSRRITNPLSTFTVGFDFEHDELAAAAETAKLFGCKHHEIMCRASDVQLLPQIVYHLDEPVGDPIVIPMFQLAREAKRHVTVVLAGEGADETLGGYLFHKVLLLGHELDRFLPSAIRRLVLSPALALTPASLLNLAFSYPADLGRRGKMKVLDFVNLLEPHQLGNAYLHLISLFDHRDTANLYTEDFRKSIDAELFPANGHLEASDSVPYLNRILHLQFPHWLPDDILMKQDKMSMAHGIEARVPYLDHELVEYALKLPPSLKIRAGKSKYILRQYSRRILPKTIATRRKMPFYTPIERFFSERIFQDLIFDTLSDHAVRNRGILRPEAVQKLRQAMHRREFIFVKQVFSLVVLELWFRMAVDRRAVA